MQRSLPFSSSEVRKAGIGLLTAVVFLAGGRGLFAHDVITTKITWDREISRIVYKRCISCHRDGGSAMPLATYEDARPWAKAIRDQVVARTMPPWGAVKGVGSFQNDPSLTEVEIQMLVAWVEGGAPKGEDDSLAAKFPEKLKESVAPGKGAKVHRTPAEHAANPAPTKSQPVTGEFQLETRMSLAGIRPESLDDGQSMLVDAWLPDGSVEHLIWLRDYRKQWTRDYLFRTPLKLPQGTTIHVKAPPTAKAMLLY